MEYKYKLGFIGGGNMAKAILNGILNNNVVEKFNILISDPFLKEDICGVKVVNDNSLIFENCEYVILAIKPQIFNQICQQFGTVNSKYVISIMAGVSTQKIKSCIPNSQIIRIMPNTPCSVGEGMSVICAKDVDQVGKQFVIQLFECIGKATFLDENKFDAVTSISGSGPAYVLYFIQSMIQGGIDGGLDIETSKLLTLQTFIGTCKMLENSNQPVEELIDKVCSKGGTTIQAIDHYRDNNLDQIINKGIEKCRLRSEELSK